MHSLEKEGYEYGYAMFEQLPDIYVDSSKHKPVLAVDVSNISITITKQEFSKDKENQLSLSTKELIDEKNNNTFSSIILKLIKDMKVPLDIYFIV